MATTKRHYLEVMPGIDLYVEETGEGLPLVFIPGLTCTTELFARQVAHFADRYRVVTFDPRCQGRSTKTVTGISYPQQGRDLACLIEHLRLEQPVLLPWSYGCLAVWELFRQRGIGDTAAVVFIDQSPRTVSCAPGEWSDGDLNSMLAFQRRMTDAPRDFSSFFEYMWQEPPSESEMDWVSDRCMQTPEFAARLLAADGLARDETDIAETIDGKFPVLHVVSEPSASAARTWLARHCPSARIEPLGHHFMFWEHADRFNAIVDGLLAEHGL